MTKKTSISGFLTLVALGLLINFSPLPGCMNPEVKKPTTKLTATKTSTTPPIFLSIGSSRRLPSER